jgi:hypothetical protein
MIYQPDREQTLKLWISLGFVRKQLDFTCRYSYSQWMIPTDNQLHPEKKLMVMEYVTILERLSIQIELRHL